MSETKEQGKHTPRPWIRQQYTIKRADGRVLAKCNIEHNDENDANAHLIAAAPELLEACGEVFRMLSEPLSEPWDALNVIKNLMQNAIAKAEGRQ